MAEAVGPFAAYDINREHMLRVIKNHARVAGSLEDELEGLTHEPLRVNHALLAQMDQQELSSVLTKSWNSALDAGAIFGYRNAQVSVMAPTGTISFAMDCASTSIEPFFSHVVYKKLSGGGFMKLANPVVSMGLRNLGYTEEQIKDINDHIMREKDGQIIDGQIEDAPWLKPEHLAVFDTANQCGHGKRYIHYQGHVLMVAALTPLLSGAISKTVNLPNEATVDDFKNVQINAWKLGVKGITLYRDGSKFTQPLNIYLNQDHGTLPLEELQYVQLLEQAQKMKKQLDDQNKMKSQSLSSRREKPVGIRTGRTHPAQIEDVKIYTTVNRGGNGEISEIYITTDREGTLIMGLLNSLSKTISVMLQYKIPPQNISKMLRGQKYEPYGFVTRHPYIKYCTSISDLISKVIDIEIGDYSRCQVKPEQPETQPADQLGSMSAMFTGASVETTSSSASGAIIDLEYRASIEDEDDEEAPTLAFPSLNEREYATGAQQEPDINGVTHYPEGSRSKAQKSQAPMESQIGLEDFIHEDAREAAVNGE
jgi:ribonucleoside-diphosphate reductase alpha chain